MMSNPIFRKYYIPNWPGEGGAEERMEITTDWPDETPATREFIETPDPIWLHREYRTLFFHLSNGSATYRIARRNAAAGIYFLVKVG